MAKIRKVGTRSTRIGAIKLRSDFTISRSRKPFLVTIKKKGKKFDVLSQDKK